MTKTFKTRALLTLCIVIVAYICMPGLAADPGSSEDPLVSMSYINEVVIPQMKSYVDAQTMSGAGSKYELINLKKGQTIIGEQSTEFILRSGKASVVATTKGGIADVTLGKDLKNGEVVPSNHQLIVPFSDWRGLSINADSIVMVKGTYSVHD